MKKNWGLLLVALLAAFDCFADEGTGTHTKCSEAYGPGYRSSALDLLDAETPADRRAAALEGYLRVSALPHCTADIHTLGQAYRHGPELPGNLVPQDTARARELLLQVAEAGRLSVYADLAEMALRQGDAREAMKWTQVYLYFVKNVQKAFLDRDGARFNSAGYNGNLLLRAERAWRKARPRLDRKLIEADLSDYVQQSGRDVTERIRTGFTERRERVSEEAGSQVRGRSTGLCEPEGMRGIDAAAVVYIVEVLPSGEIGRVLPESFFPDPAAAEKLAHCVHTYAFEPFEGEQPRTVRIPVVFGYAPGVFTPSFKL